jgi:hypothetical protein
MHATEGRGIMDPLCRVALHSQPVLPLLDRQLFTNVTNHMLLLDLSSWRWKLPFAKRNGSVHMPLEMKSLDLPAHASHLCSFSAVGERQYSSFSQLICWLAFWLQHIWRPYEIPNLGASVDVCMVPRDEQLLLISHRTHGPNRRTISVA